MVKDNRRYYLDLKENSRGRFLRVSHPVCTSQYTYFPTLSLKRRICRLSHVVSRGVCACVLFSMDDQKKNRTLLKFFADEKSYRIKRDGGPSRQVYAQTQSDRYDSLTLHVLVHWRCALISPSVRRRFFSLSLLQVSQTITRGGPRTQIAIPAQGMIEFRDALTDLLEEFGTDDGGFKGDLPEGRYMRVDSKNFYFDIGQNNRGIYMRISEVRALRSRGYARLYKNLTLSAHICDILYPPTVIFQLKITYSSVGSSNKVETYSLAFFLNVTKMFQAY